MQVKEQFPDIAFGEVGKKLGGCRSAPHIQACLLKAHVEGELARWQAGTTVSRLSASSPSAVHMPLNRWCALQALEEAHGMPVSVLVSH